MNKIPKIFSNLDINVNRLQKIETLDDPRSRYLIAMTPRSGSSYLCDIMKKTHRFGSPDEKINENSLPVILKNIPGRNPDEYLRNVMRATKTVNRVSGLKASWYQFKNFTSLMSDTHYLQGFKYIYLTRQDLPAQAVSLYKATASSVFHTNIQHHEQALVKLEHLNYDFVKIKNWYDHIVAQEQGWLNYFDQYQLTPLTITYEEIELDLLSVLKKIAVHVKVTPGKIVIPARESVFKKIRDDRSVEWAKRFEEELSNSFSIQSWFKKKYACR
jgi:LPS sulfotransferase NodH